MTSERRARVACLALIWIPAIASLAGFGALAHAHQRSLFDLRLPTTGLPLLGWLGLLLGYAIAERTQAHIEVRRQSFRLTVTEIPLVLGLVLVAPAALLGITLLARACSWAGMRQNAYKRVFNLGIGTLEVGVLELLAHAGGLPFLEPHRMALAAPLMTRAVCAVFLAALASSLLGTAAVLLALTWLHGSVERDTQGQLFSVQAVSASVGTIFALLGLQVAPGDPIGITLLSLLMLGAVGAYRAYAGLVRQHRTVKQLYDFSRALSLNPASPENLPASVLDGVLVAMECEKAILWERVDEVLIPVVRGLSVADALRSSGIAQLVWTDRRPLFLRAPAVGVTGRARSPSRPIPAGLRETLLVPIAGSGGLTGVLQVADRFSDATRFCDNDVTVLSTLAAQLATSLENTVRGELLEHAAFHDQLTGLANRSRFGIDLAEAVEGAKVGHCSAVLLLDLDRFKEVNDSLGHHLGDQLLAAIADRISSALPPSAIAARLGGDEFAVLMPVHEGELGFEEAMQAALLLRQAIAHPVSIAGVDLVVGASFGIVVLPVHGVDPTRLLQHADVAMYAAKAAERPIVVYEAGLDDDSTRHLRLAADLRHALERNRLEVVFQPKIDLVRDEVVGVEALSRWTHPVHGFISPDEFIPIAERTGLIVPLTQQVLRTAVEQCRIWRQRGMDIGVAVNLSLRGLLDEEFVAEIRDVLAENDVPARLLTLEITESSVMRDPDRTMPILHSLRDMGVKLSVDDFGTGYSSLAHLRRLPVHEVKVDKSFVLSMSTDPANAAIVRAVVDLGSTLGLNVVAEGVEDTHSRDALISMGCPTGQGYLFARPLAPDRLDIWLAEHRIRSVLGQPRPGRSLPVAVVPGPRSS